MLRKGYKLGKRKSRLCKRSSGPRLANRANAIPTCGEEGLGNCTAEVLRAWRKSNEAVILDRPSLSKEWEEADNRDSVLLTFA